MAIVGPSGAGKSSLLGVLSGLRDPAAGQVLYQGRDLHADGEELTRRIGFVPQADVLHDGLTVRASLRYTEQLRLSPDATDEERDERIDEVLAQLGMSDRSEARIDRLSGGERKRVNVATELLTKPSLLLLDEPASGLDAGLERTLMRLLRSLADAGRTIIVVTHSLDSLDLCDRLLVLAPGGVPAYMGHPAGLEDRFGHADLVETFNDLATVDADWRDPRMPNTGDEPGPVARVMPEGQAPKSAAVEAGRGPRRAAREWISQVAALSQRFVSVLASDRRNMMLLLAQAPILGVLMLIAMPTNELSMPSPTQIRFVSTAGLVLFVVLLGSTWLGANNAIREIANERALFLRERAAGLSSTAYVVSKALVLGVFTAIQSAVLVAIATAAQRGPVDAVFLGWARAELIVIVALAGVASMALSLLISAIVGTPDRATTLLPIVLILQFVLSAGGVLPEIVDKPVLRELATLSSAQWGFAGSASTADLNQLQAFTDQLRDLREVDAADPGPALAALAEPVDPPQRWAHTPSAWFMAAGALVVLTLAPLGAAVIVLRRKEPLP
jgi:ABC-type multidrug transport system ATPase subunit